MVCDGSKSFKIAAKCPISSHRVAGPIGPATRCDAVLPRWDVPIHLRCPKIACDGRRCIFQHVGNFAPDFGISQPLIVRFSIGLQYSDGHSIGFPVIYDSKLPVKYFLLPSQRWTSQENIETFHRDTLLRFLRRYMRWSTMVHDASKSLKSPILSQRVAGPCSYSPAIFFAAMVIGNI